MRTALAIAICLFIGAGLYGQATVRLEDSSDWWSVNNEHFPDATPGLQDKAFNTNNFRILGLSLDTVGVDSVASRLGSVQIVERGNASYSRSQLCYASKEGTEKIYLIFEFSVGQSAAFYLFRGGANWTGESLCARTSAVNENVSTGTGLKLGLSQSAVIAILGKPDYEMGDRMAYSRRFYRTATKQEFETARREYPEALSDEAAQTQFGTVPVTMQLEARFKNDRLTYLYVSTLMLNVD
jgi:hypothetical protein